MASARRLALLRLHQRTSNLDDRERLTRLAETLQDDANVIVLATCHRVEFYGALPPLAEPREWFIGRLGSGGAEAAARASAAADSAVARHLLRVACGLDSALRGERQILAQIRRTYDAARAQRRLEPILSELFRLALHVGREVRTVTALGKVHGSVGSIAVEEGLRLLAEPSRATALVIGAGEVGKLAAHALSRRVGRVIVANRDAARAASVAADIGGEPAALEELEGALARADLVMAAAHTRGALLTGERLRARLSRGSLVIVDLAVPRSVDWADRHIPGLVYRDVDDLQPPADPLLDEAVASAERRCEQEAAAFMARRREREASETIRALRERADAVRHAELARALGQLRHLDARDRDVVGALASRLTNALMHAPTTTLRRIPDRAEAAEELFDLEKAR